MCKNSPQRGTIILLKSESCTKHFDDDDDDDEIEEN